MPATQFTVEEKYTYRHGLGSYHETEAVKGALPVGQNSPQNAAHGLYAEKLSGTAFTAPRSENLQSWLYRILPSVTHRAFQPAKAGLAGYPENGKPEYTQVPNQLRWRPFEASEDLDFISGLRLVAGAGDPTVKTGLAIYIYGAGKHMAAKRAFYSADGHFLIVAQQGSLDIQTEFGRLLVRPGEIAVIPRGIRYRVELPDGASRGYVLELFQGQFQLPELGPIGSCGLANPRDFQIPVACYEDDQSDWIITTKFGGRLFDAAQAHSPFDVVAWHGNYYPYKYDLGRFNTIGSISYDHPDPSIFTVLTAPSPVTGTAVADFVIFPPRWLVAEDTFRPPWYHRNTMSEFMGLITGGYDAKVGGEDGFQPGGASLHNVMAAHGPDAATFEAASTADLAPQKVGSGSMAFMFESSLMLGVTDWSLTRCQRVQEEPQVHGSQESSVQSMTLSDSIEVSQAAQEHNSPSTDRDAGFTPPGSSNYFLNLAEELHVSSESVSIATQKSMPHLVSFTQVLRQAYNWRLSNGAEGLASFIGLNQWLSIIKKYEEEIGLQYPFMDLDTIGDELKTVCLSSAMESRLITSNKEHILALLLAIVAVLENPDVSKLADTFTEKSREYAAVKSQTETVDEDTIRLLMLVSVYYFMTDRETLSWRCIGSVLRTLQELGYHNSKPHRPNFIRERTKAEKLFWSAYIMDRRWSFGTGLPFAISESDINHDVEIADDSLSSEYIRAMVAYCRISTECRSSVLCQTTSNTARDFSDFRVVEWRRNLPHFLRFDSNHAAFNPVTESRSQYRFRLLLYLRANQLRTVIRRHSIFRSGPRDVDLSSMQTAIEVACDTIRILVTVVQTSDIYQAQQKTFNHFLESSISSLLLFIAHRKDNGDSSCFEELHMAMGLVRGLAPQSCMMRKLCDKLERLKVVQAALTPKTRGHNMSVDSLVPSNNRIQGATNQPVGSHREPDSEVADPLPPAALTPASDGVACSRNCGADIPPFASGGNDVGLPDVGPKPTYATSIETPVSTQVASIPPTIRYGLHYISQGSYPPDTALSIDSEPFGESNLPSGVSEEASVEDADALPYVFFEDMQDFLEVQDSTFTF
ncbi:hypothetical protein jhhlp_002668 [Lomentospora prolificans]|uniref:homogentisate 1,2-dioxygenase n=1 Tax=Lomentospora prolificans TaxID=41688 RepID=A0A2N3NEN0_9PEZI|nr:hypothetical protein jhhlp_002668 [Lomentospora prolificans]